MRKLLLLMLVSCLALTVEAQTKKPTPSSGTTPKKTTTTTTSKPSSTYKPSSTTTKPRTTTVPSNTTTYPSSTPTTPTTVETPPPPTAPTAPSSSTVGNAPSKSAPSVPSKPGKPTPEKGTKVVTEKAPKVPSKPSAPKPPKTPSASSLADDVHARIGVKGGAVNLFSIDKDVELDIAPSYEAGFVVNLPLGNVVSIQPEFLYTALVVKTKPVNNSYVQVSANAVTVPLMINFNFGGDTKFMLNLGGYGTYALNASLKGVDNGTTVLDTKEDYKDAKFEDRTDYGAAVGVGVKFNQKFFVEARGYQSLKSEKDPITGNSAMPKQVVATLSLGYFF
jgi:Outer membrane protein beta-barrel domain